MFRFISFLFCVYLLASSLSLALFFHEPKKIQYLLDCVPKSMVCSDEENWIRHTRTHEIIKKWKERETKTSEEKWNENNTRRQNFFFLLIFVRNECASIFCLGLVICHVRVRPGQQHRDGNAYVDSQSYSMLLMMDVNLWVLRIGVCLRWEQHFRNPLLNVRVIFRDWDRILEGVVDTMSLTTTTSQENPLIRHLVVCMRLILRIKMWEKYAPIQLKPIVKPIECSLTHTHAQMSPIELNVNARASVSGHFFA